MFNNPALPARRVLLLAVISAAVCLSWTGPLLAQQHIVATKNATALVEIPKGSRKLFSTAFCVNDSGIFVTNAHVTKQVAPGGKITLVLNIGEAKQAKIPATVIRTDEKTDLALLRASKAQTYPSLTLGDTKALVETAKVTAFGFPFGKSLSVSRESYPSMSVNVGRITSIRKQRGKVERIQLDAALNPGNSGGPVIDANGKVVGIVVSGIRGSGVNFAIPVEHLKKLIAKPDVEFKPPSISYKKRYDPANFAVKVTPLKAGGDSAKSYTVTLSLTGPTGKPRVATAKTEDGGKYLITIPPMVKIALASRLLDATLEFPNGSIQAKANNAKIKIGANSVYLSSLEELKISAESCEGKTFKGKKITGKITGSSTVRINLGGDTIPIDLKKAKSLAIAPFDTEGSGVQYVLSIKSGSTTVYESEGVLNCGSPPASASGVASIGRPATGSVKRLTGDPKTITLPAPCSDVALGGSGRYILLYLKTLRKIAVYDVYAVKIAGYIPLSGDDLYFAAGASHVIVVYKAENILQRWSLATLKKELTRTTPVKGSVNGIAMGSACNTLLINGGAVPRTSGSSRLGTFRFFDVRTMKEMKMQANNMSSLGMSLGSRVYIRVSPNGQLYGMWRMGGSPTGLACWVVTGNQVDSRYEHTSVGYIVPDAAGTALYTARGGIYSVQLKRLTDSRTTSGQWMIPSHHPAYYITVPMASYSSRSRNQKPQRGSIYTKGSSTPLASLPEMPEMTSSSSSRSSRYGRYGNFTYEKRYQFFPHLDMLITIPHSNDKLVVRPYNVKKALAEKGIDYLYVTSTPPTEAQSGALFSYQVKVESKSGGIIYKLDSAPAGMKISSRGLITWRAKKAIGGGLVTVIASVSDKSGQELFHTFKLSVR